MNAVSLSLSQNILLHCTHLFLDHRWLQVTETPKFEAMDKGALPVHCPMYGIALRTSVGLQLCVLLLAFRCVSSPKWILGHVTWMSMAQGGHSLPGLSVDSPLELDNRVIPRQQPQGTLIQKVWDRPTLVALGADKPLGYLDTQLGLGLAAREVSRLLSLP